MCANYCRGSFLPSTLSAFPAEGNRDEWRNPTTFGGLTLILTLNPLQWAWLSVLILHPGLLIYETWASIFYCSRSKERNKALWQLQEVSNNSEGQGAYGKLIVWSLIAAMRPESIQTLNSACFIHPNSFRQIKLFCVTKAKRYGSDFMKIPWKYFSSRLTVTKFPTLQKVGVKFMVGVLKFPVSNYSYMEG